jgi:uncharacterized membrane protein YkvA (DUF1232 family)
MADIFHQFLDKLKPEDQRNFGGIINNLRLIVRLLKDPRVNSLLKLLPIGALIYLIVPFDFSPINPLDDAAVLWLGGTLFIELCPDEIIKEHRRALSGDREITQQTGSDVVDVDYKDVPSSRG